MVEKCVNPLCSTPFRRLGRGKLFAFEARTPANVRPSRADGRKTSSSFFWLCDKCSLNHTLAIDVEGNLKIEKNLPALPVLEDGGLTDARVGEIA
jgi:hypothetical protein